MTTYLFGIAEGKFDVKAIYSFIKEYWSDWFPDMPKYQNYNRRINLLSSSFQALYGLLISEQAIDKGIHSHLIDSMPIIVASQKRSNHAKAARGVCDKGYCSSKGIYYYGVKLHVLGQKQYQALPLVCMANVTPASDNDITVAKEWLCNIQDMDIYADKMYASEAWSFELAQRNVNIFTPVKLKKGQVSLDSADKLFSSAISRARQAIESFFNWIHQKTHIQSASKVRSVSGLIAFIFARLAALVCFYS